MSDLCNPRYRTIAWLLCSGMFLAACGAGQLEDSELLAESAAVPVVTPLLDDVGQVMPSDPQAIPADVSARTRAGRYATSAQARVLRNALGSDLRMVEVACCAEDALKHAVAQAFAGRATVEAVLVSGSDMRLAAAAVERFNDLNQSARFLARPARLATVAINSCGSIGFEI